MRTGIFGGTFNPVHNGHVRLAQTYMRALLLDRILVIPSHQPPHKSSVQVIAGEHRLAMCRMAFADVLGCEVNDFELMRAQKSYTVDTLAHLHGQYPNDSFYLLMGGDMFLTMTEWRSWERIAQLATLCAGAREAGQRELLERYAKKLSSLGADCRVVDIQPFEVSSTQIRERISAGKDIHGLVPPDVADYIEQNGLYQL